MGWRSGVAGAAVAGTMQILIFTAGASAQAPPPELLPDLQGQKAQDLRVESGGGVRNLRLSTTVANAGTGALEIYPVAATDCDGDGNPANDRLAYQRVYTDTDGSGYFDRAADTTSAQYPAGCMIFHPAHNHWHFQDFASYELRAPETGDVIAATSKVSFCAVDFTPFDVTLLGHPTDPYYDTCSEDDTEGISVGWADTYTWPLAGQEIDIRDVPDGHYCLAVTGDPANILRESDESNNEAVSSVTLNGNSVTQSGGPCTGTARPDGSRSIPAAVKKCKRQKGKRAKKGGRKKKRRRC